MKCTSIRLYKLHWHNRNMKTKDDGLCLNLGLDSECRSKEDWNIDCYIFKPCCKDYFYNVSFLKSLCISQKGIFIFVEYE